MLPKKIEPILFGWLLSGVMSLLVSGISTYRATGIDQEFGRHWIGSWLTAWLLGFPAVLVATPLVRRMVNFILFRGPTRP